MKKRVRVFQIIFVLILILPVVVYLSFQTQGEEPIPFKLDGNWQLEKISGIDLISGSHITVSFSDSQNFSGFAGCNDYGGKFELTSQKLIFIEEIESTEEGCTAPVGVLKQEGDYFSALLESRRFKIDEDSLTLLSEDENAKLVFSREQYFEGETQLSNGPIWVLDSIDGEVVDSFPGVRLYFYGEAFGGFTGCRHFFGTYMLDQSSIDITRITMFELMCTSPETTLLENRFLDSLDHFQQIRETTLGLEVKLKTGGILTFSPSAISRRIDMSRAETTLSDFFTALVSMDYDTAADLYGGPETFTRVLAELNPEVPSDDLPQLLKHACLNQFRCMHLGEIRSSQLLMENAIVFTVVFENPDGTPFKYSECCNGEAPETDSPTRYDFLVVDDVGGMKVFGRLVPVP